MDSEKGAQQKITKDSEIERVDARNFLGTRQAEVGCTVGAMSAGLSICPI
jgi:hypothetical protein